MTATNTYVVLSSAGINRDHAAPTRAQPFWDEHAAFIDQLVADGFILLGGPLSDEGGAMLVVHAETDRDVRARLAVDPWYEHDILKLESVKRWEIFIDQRS